ncbi:MAG: thioredoxin domain-containing protein [Anaerolineae bacterium]|nr:thioredoxin domain-containing protein [Anaerolineae bacterium]
MPNRLIGESSPYLLKHAHNPVDWFPWGPEALDAARRQDKPIFLSIGYSSCHWCSVMEDESFVDETTARFMNANFVNIKVDREERPDLDSIYMNAVVAMTGQGGWPMSVFLTPDGKPFYGGTYYPKTRRYGMPAFMDVLQGIAKAWENQRLDVEQNGLQMQQALSEGGVPRGADEMPLDKRTLELALNSLARSFDTDEGGWGGAPKFPQPMTLEFLIRTYAEKPDDLVLKMITLTLHKMARGGMYDQLGGGFHRYSTDDHWGTPHFERMLYDNGQLARVYLHAYQITGNEFYKRVTTEILDYVVREMTSPEGGFYSSQDADSEGHEGKFFVWTPEEIRSALGGSTSGLLIVSKSKQDVSDTALFMDAYGVTERGNFEGKNILHRTRDTDVLAEMHRMSGDEVERKLDQARSKLFAARERRIKPARDEKILTGWNGLMLAAFAEAARVLGRSQYSVASSQMEGSRQDVVKGARYAEIAKRNADFLLANLRDENGRLKRSYKDGQARLNGYLEDYANLAEGLLALYETTFEEKYWVAARELADVMLEHFTDPRGGFFDTSDDHEELVVRPKDVQDNATPSGGAMATLVLFKLGAYMGGGKYVEAAERAVGPLQPALAQAPMGFAWWLCGLEFELAPPKEIAIVGEGAQPLLDVVFGEYRPNQVVAWKRDGDESAIPLLEYRETKDGKATAYICQNFACQMPTTDPEALAKQSQVQ